jgi:hypothetical protein
MPVLRIKSANDFDSTGKMPVLRIKSAGDFSRARRRGLPVLAVLRIKISGDLFAFRQQPPWLYRIYK